MSSRPSSLIVVNRARRPERGDLAQQLAERLGVPCTSSTATQAEYRLLVNDDLVELCDATMKPGRGIRAEFSSLDVRPGSKGRSRNQPLVKAMGRGTKTILDATAGMGQDAFLLACLGYEVTMIERSPIVAVLLEDAMRRAREDLHLRSAINDRLQLMEADSRSVLAKISHGPESERPDVVYLDPMFPPKRKQSALPRKEIQMLRTIAGDDPDAAELFKHARIAAMKRIVVKRPTHAPPLAPNPVASHEGKLARFDVYLPSES